MSPIWVAIDTPDLERAVAIATRVGRHVGGIKLGLEFFNANGPQGIASIAELGLPVFADLKMHDIPNTVAGGIRAVLPLGVSIVNVHASGGRAMMKAAAEAAATAGPRRPKVIAVTVLTSMDEADLNETGVPGAPAAQVIRLATLARDAGIDGVDRDEVVTLGLALGIHGAGQQQLAADQARILPGRDHGTDDSGEQHR